MILLEFVNILRTIPVMILVSSLHIIDIVKRDMKKYEWYINAPLREKFMFKFNKLLLRNDCFRNVVYYRITSKQKVFGYFYRILYPIKKDLEIHGEIGPGLAIYHGHGTIITPNKIGDNFSVYQGVTVGKNPHPNKNVITPTIGNNVTIYANAVVAGGINIGDNVVIGAGAIVMKDIPSNSVVIGNPCVIKRRTK